MSRSYRFVFSIYFFNALSMVIAGLVYQFRGEFMPYHADVIQTPWAELAESSQILYLGMMRTEAAGFLSCGVAIFILLFLPFRQKALWSSYAICLIGIVEYLPSAVATYRVANQTLAEPPWVLLWIAMLSLGIALVVSTKSSEFRGVRK